MGRLNGGLWRHGVAVTWMVGRPAASSWVVAHGWRPRALLPSRLGHAGLRTACLTVHARASSATSSQPSREGSRCGPGYSMTSVTVFDV